jgi:hypothetical protein
MVIETLPLTDAAREGSTATERSSLLADSNAHSNETRWMSDLTPPYLRSIHPPYRLTPRSAITAMPDEAEPEAGPGISERIRRLASRWLP